MKKLMMSGFAAVVLTLAATGSALAQPASCDPAFFDAQKNHSETLRARDAMGTAQRIKKPDSTQALSCLDQGMGMSAKAGDIFSDVIPDPGDLPTFDAAIATGLGTIYHTPDTSPDLAGSRTEQAKALGDADVLLRDIDSTVGDILDEFLSDFTGSLGQGIGGMLSSELSNIVDDLLGSFGGFGGFLAGLMGVSYDCDRPSEVWDLLVGNGLDTESPIGTLDEMLAGGMSGGTDFQTLFDIFDTGIFDQARNIDTSVLIPGGMPSWQTPPIMPANPTLDDIIGAM